MASPHRSGHQENHLRHITSKKNYISESNMQSVFVHVCGCTCVCTWGPCTVQPGLQEQLSPLSLPPAIALTLPEVLQGPCIAQDQVLPRMDLPGGCGMVGARLFGAACSHLRTGLGSISQSCRDFQKRQFHQVWHHFSTFKISGRDLPGSPGSVRDAHRFSKTEI